MAKLTSRRTLRPGEIRSQDRPHIRLAGFPPVRAEGLRFWGQHLQWLQREGPWRWSRPVWPARPGPAQSSGLRGQLRALRRHGRTARPCLPSDAIAHLQQGPRWAAPPPWTRSRPVSELGRPRARAVLGLLWGLSRVGAEEGPPHLARLHSGPHCHVHLPQGWLHDVARWSPGSATESNPSSGWSWTFASLGRQGKSSCPLARPISLRVVSSLSFVSLATCADAHLPTGQGPSTHYSHVPSIRRPVLHRPQPPRPCPCPPFTTWLCLRPLLPTLTRPLVLVHCPAGSTHWPACPRAALCLPALLVPSWIGTLGWLWGPQVRPAWSPVALVWRPAVTLQVGLCLLVPAAPTCIPGHLSIPCRGRVPAAGRPLGPSGACHS